MNSGIYYILNKINQKRYIGSTRDFNLRKNEHWSKLRNNKHTNLHLQNSWNLHGEENFKFHALLMCEKKILLEQEKYWIEKYETSDKKKGYNIEKDPICRSKSKSTREKISNTWKEKYSKGYVHPNKGKKFGPEVIKNMRKAQSGKKLSKSHVEKMSKSLQKPIIQCTMDGVEIRKFPSTKSAAESLSIKGPHITRCLKGRRKSTGGYTFKYDDKVKI